MDGRLIVIKDLIVGHTEFFNNWVKADAASWHSPSTTTMPGSIWGLFPRARLISSGTKCLLRRVFPVIAVSLLIPVADDIWEVQLLWKRSYSLASSRAVSAEWTIPLRWPNQKIKLFNPWKEALLCHLQLSRLLEMQSISHPSDPPIAFDSVEYRISAPIAWYDAGCKADEGDKKWCCRPSLIECLYYLV